MAMKIEQSKTVMTERGETALQISVAISQRRRRFSRLARQLHKVDYEIQNLERCLEGLTDGGLSTEGAQERARSVYHG
jgi:hypothetical protein